MKTFPSLMGAGERMHRLLRELYPICRSITGAGLRETLQILSQHVPLELREIASGTPVFDWTIPDEWNIQSAWIEDPKGFRIVDFANHNLHVVNYSIPVDQVLSLDELQPHLHSLPDQPDAIPYRTSYYQDAWGFCLPHRLREQLAPGLYRVRIHASKQPGSLTFGETCIPGGTSKEFLLSAHVCHPSLANDNLSGVVIAIELMKWLQRRADRMLTYRFLFMPGTIGAITWLSQNPDCAQNVHGGLILSGLGDRGPLTYKRSRKGATRIDRIMERLLVEAGEENKIQPFIPYGYDERQFCSPGFDLPMGTISRSPYGTYPEYHTSNDSPDFVSPAQLEQSLVMVARGIEQLEEELVSPEGLYWNTQPHCEAQLGRRGLYGQAGPGDAMAYLWILNQSDGSSSLSDIASCSGVSIDRLSEAAKALEEAGLLRRIQ